MNVAEQFKTAVTSEALPQGWRGGLERSRARGRRMGGKRGLWSQCARLRNNRVAGLLPDWERW
jgi:hypothetical protein